MPPNTEILNQARPHDSERAVLSLRVQHWLSWLNAPWFLAVFLFLFRMVGSYRCAETRRIRLAMREVMRQIGDGPLLICANHLTLIDSMIINWLLFGWWQYLKHWRLMPWNMPERGNFGRNLPMWLMSYFGKCVFVKRGGSLAERRATLHKITLLLKEQQTICIFPEGTRSREGMVRGSAPTYSVGELCQAVPQTRVLCVYLRGIGQRNWGALPKRGESFFVALNLLEPIVAEAGRRGAKHIAQAIMESLVALEDRYVTLYPGPPFEASAATPIDAATKIP